MSDQRSAIDAVIDGTLRYAVLCGDATEVMKIVPSETIHVSYNDPPYGLSEQTTDSIIECLRAWLDGKVYSHNRQGFMGTEWDAYVPGPEAWREVNRVLKPGGYNVSFSSTRTVDLLGMAIRLAGFSVRPGFAWLQGAGFPKSLDVSKQIDAAYGAERAVIGATARPDGTMRNASNGGGAGSSLAGSVSGSLNTNGAMAMLTAPSTDAAKQWDGYGTDVKPAYEPLVVARKNMDGTVAANVLAHGCGVLNIDAARISHVTVGDGNLALNPHLRATINGGNGGNIFPREEERRVVEPHANGRFPAAVVGVHDEGCELVGVTRIRGDARTGGGTREGGFVDTGASSGDSVPCAAGKADPDGTETVDEWRCAETCAVAELARQSGHLISGSGAVKRATSAGHKSHSIGTESRPEGTEMISYGDFGSAARFFYQAKASASDRLAYMTCSDGCEHNDHAAWLKDARASVRDGRQEPIGGKCIDVDVAAPTAHAAITAMLVREVLDEVIGITRQALGEDVVSNGSTCIDAALAMNAVASAMADQSSDEIVTALAERGTALAPRTMSCARSSATAEGESQEGSICVPRSGDDADPAWPSPGFCRSCGAPRTNYQHPTVKPQSLANWHAKLLSLPAEVSPIAIVPFCGTGIEAKALLDAGFRVIAIDIDPRHVTMTEFRLANGAPDEARTTTRSDSHARTMPSKPTKALRGKQSRAGNDQLDLFGKKS